MPTGIVNHERIIKIEPRSVVGGNIKLVIVFLTRNEISGPAGGEVVHGAALDVGAFAPAKIDVFIGANKCRFATQVFIIKIFALQPSPTSRIITKLRIPYTATELPASGRSTTTH